MNLPDPECLYGYTQPQLDQILGERQDDFREFMRGQTISLCDGKKWNYASQREEESGCGPHGAVVYPTDLRRFMRFHR